MSFSRRFSVALVSSSSLLGMAWLVDGCGSDSATDTNTADASQGTSADSGGGGGNSDGGGNVDTDGGAAKGDSGGGGNDGGGGSCAAGKVIDDAGETCVGFGQADPCTAACGLYGYRCFGGHPPGFASCLQLNASAILGETYCCPKNDCVAEPDQDKQCNGFAGKPHRFQCPPTDAGWATPAAGCVDAGAAGPLEHFFCCP